MRIVRRVASVVVLSQLAGCVTYAFNVEDPPRDVVGILAGAEVATGLAIGVAMKATDNSLGSLAEDLLAGVVGVFLLDLAVGLGVRVSDYTNSAAPEPRVLRLGGSF